MKIYIKLNKRFRKVPLSITSLPKHKKQFIPPPPYANNSQILNHNTTNNISQFYEGSNIFLTGATGFLGKILLEKLLRDCNKLQNIYVLIRQKKGLNPEERLKSLLESPVFHRLKESNAEYLDKVKLLYGDVAKPDLGLNESDRELIKDTVNIVFHSAATVRFMEDLRYSVQVNARGTKAITELCKSIKNLKEYIMGIRQHILKENISNINHAKSNF